jgi:Fe-S oxidoreductase
LRVCVLTTSYPRFPGDAAGAFVADAVEHLRAAGLEVEPVTGGCCGLAGSFGFEAAHYELSMACGEHELLPRVREAPAEVLVVADGFSCKTQIAHGTGRRALHIAEVLVGR